MILWCFMMELVCPADKRLVVVVRLVLWWCRDGQLWTPLLCKMVATRGNTVNEKERRSSLPSRESRRSTKGAMQEPEDEVEYCSLSREGGGSVGTKFHPCNCTLGLG